MYEKNLTKDLRLRLSETDMDFLTQLSDERGISVSAVIRSIIGDYRRSLDMVSTLKSALNLAQKEMSKNGDTESYLDNQL